MKSINNYWKSRNIQGPDGSLFFGVLLELFNGVYEFDSKQFEQYGKTFGDILKGIPDIVTMDIDLIQKILISEFDCFTDQSNVVSTSKSKNDLKKMMLHLQKGEDWRRIRRKVTPAMTSAKMKNLIPAMNYCVKELVNYLEPFATDGTDVPLRE